MEYYLKAKEMYPNAKCELNYNNNFEFLVAVILSRQTKDREVNKITPVFFEKYKDFYDLSNAAFDALYKIIKPLGLANSKTRDLINLSKSLASIGYIPTSLEELKKLDGVGNKTACVYMAEIYKEPHIAVDTHVSRVANRLGLSKECDPLKIQKDLENRYDTSLWIDIHHTFLFLGRYTCLSKHPKCETCLLKDMCKYYKENLCH